MAARLAAISGVEATPRLFVQISEGGRHVALELAKPIAATDSVLLTA